MTRPLPECEMYKYDPKSSGQDVAENVSGGPFGPAEDRQAKNERDHHQRPSTNPSKQGPSRVFPTSASREEALARTLAMRDFTQEQELKKWAIQELGKSRTQDSQSILEGFALDLQNRCYDKDGKRVRLDEDRLDVYAPLFYNTIVDLLRNRGLSDAQIKATGVQHDRFFTLAP